MEKRVAFYLKHLVKHGYYGVLDVPQDVREYIDRRELLYEEAVSGRWLLTAAGREFLQLHG